MRSEFANILLDKAINSPEIILVVGDLGYGVFDRYQKMLPTQYVNSGITEQSSVSYVAGLARMGLRPFFYSIGNFPTFRALEQIRNDVCYMNLPVTIVAVGAGFSYGTAGYSHHLIEDLSALTALNLDIYTPTMPNEVLLCLNQIMEQQRPAYLRLGKGGEKDFAKEHSVFKFPNELDLAPKAQVNLLVNGSIIEEVVIATKKLLEKGVTSNIYSCWNMNFLVKEDIRFLTQLENLVVVEEHVTRGGFGSFINETLPITAKKAEVFGLPRLDLNVAGSARFLRKHYELDAESIANRILNILKR